VKFGIHRRTIDLVPPSAEDADWVFASGGSRSAATRASAKAAYAQGKFVVGVIRRHKDQQRVGFVLLIPTKPPYRDGPPRPHPSSDDAWDFTVIIPDASHRDLFSALHACDAISHYMFDYVGIRAAVWRIREDNVRAQKLGTRFPYPSLGMIEQAGAKFHLYQLDRELWKQRKTELEARAGGPAFTKLDPEN
jgi:hypothetical protein